MLQIDSLIQEFVRKRVGGVIVFDSGGNLIYEDDRIAISEKARNSFVKRRPAIDEEKKVWEFTDNDNGKYYRIETATIDFEGATYQCHLFTDVSDYAGLFQDISNYSRHIADISNFQSNIMAKLSQPFEVCLADLTVFCGSSKAIMFVEQKNDVVMCISYDQKCIKKIVPKSEYTEEMLSAKRFDMIDGCYCFLNGKLGRHRCAVYLTRSQDFNEDYFRDISVYNVIRLYIENGMLREEIIFTSEHDMLTGLFNKGKYLALKEDAFGHPDHIFILNFDVNNLKAVNDNEGHEAGDQLIVQAARSIRAITATDVMGFRTGGDEFLVVASNCDEEKGRLLYKHWQEALRSINAGSEKQCIVACGFVHGTGDYDLDALLSEADTLMYENKQNLKTGKSVL